MGMMIRKANRIGRSFFLKGVCSSAIMLASATHVHSQTTSSASKQDTPSAQDIIVTGSHIVREGYQAPTPLTVISADTLHKSAEPTLLDTLKLAPAVTGARGVGESSNTIGTGTGGVASLNLRSLGPSRVLVLIDGQRAAPSTINGLVDVSNIPEQLISRVDIVTGGASAVYGSDAVSGVVNFVLDKKFTGLKAELSGGTTAYGDNKNYKFDVSAGFGFAGGKGHILLSAQQSQSAGVKGAGGRNYTDLAGAEQFANPAYTPTNGQPALLFLTNSAIATEAPGGLIVSGPLKGTAFGQGGTPYQFNYGTLSGSYMTGGDWQQNNIRQYNDLLPSTVSHHLFARVSYDITDNIAFSAQWMWSKDVVRAQTMTAWLAGSPGAYVIQSDNAFLPASTRAAMTTNAISSFSIGSWNQDIPPIQIEESHRTNRINAALEGNFEAIGSTWRWNTHFAYGGTRSSNTADSISVPRYKLAIDSVVNPANGQIVCRSTLTDPTNGCRPWNPLGVGVNAANSAGLFYIYGSGNYSYAFIEQISEAASLSGNLFSLWAGPVSLALTAEHRRDSVRTTIDPDSAAGNHIAYNFFAVNAAQSVSEGSAELLIPLAKDHSWAKNWDLNLAARYTHYQLVGNAFTWKIGSTYAVNSSIKFRANLSRDIRAPNLTEMFQGGRYGTVAGLIDRYTGQPSASIRVLTSGNPNVSFEKADTTSLGVVLSPTFMRGFTMSVDYWRVKINNAITTLTAQPVIDGCYYGTTPAYCKNITFNTDGSINVVNVTPFNVAKQDVNGLDVEATYRIPLANIKPSMKGTVSLHGTMSFYFKDTLSSPLITTINYAGANGDGNGSPPHWKYALTASYDLQPFSVSVTGRGFSGGVISNNYLQCTSGCPTSTAAVTTINNNHAPGAFYLDANITYRLPLDGKIKAEIYFSGSNLLNKLFPTNPAGGQYYFWPTTNTYPYEYLGAEYKIGVRVQV
jgi:outer membrane receptor protein involved in Fe transport